MSNKVTGNAFDFKIFRRLMSYAKAYRSQFIFSTIAVLLLAALAAARPILLQWIVDEYILGKEVKLLLTFSLIMLGVLLLEVVFQFLFIYFTNWLGQNIIKDIRAKLFDKVLKFRMQYFNKTPVGKLVTRVVSDIETIASIFGQGLFPIISDLLQMLVVIIIMMVMNWRLGLIVVAVLPIMVYATKLFQIKIKGTFQDVRDQVSNLNSFVQERISGMKIVQLFTREKIEHKKFLNINDKHKKAHIRTIWYYSIFFPVVEILSSLTLAVIVWYGGLTAAVEGATSFGVITSFIYMTNMLFRPLRQIADKFNTLQMGMVAAERVFVVLDENATEVDTGILEIKHFKGNIKFDDVHFRYLEDEPVLRGISFEVKQGETVAVVGATGAGKSTIINLLSRFYRINSGSITIDGIELNKIKLESLRNQISVVLQDVFLFSDSILNNITLNNKDISLEEVTEAAKVIGIHDFIMTLPNNYHYNVKERGGMLSVGQRQLIAFLRAYVSKPAILVLDEATSSIDAQSERLIQKATNTITLNRTSIIIAHRLATIKKADKIIVMEKGKIVEQGTHKELLKQKGYYSKLYEIQFETAQAS
ncbi:ABC transporter ATP-binding protein [Aureibaculum sp. 2210JD6-5]|uniref:ABC transporter ATP-binding protein n=1 Tax=Aureibaculum sp. 2210JD6-5 TaxID=3103957 RepID=UPI002AAE427A|nr:ABC transporter ATP-binding protein [Aureibaculum sp. 2210JD6-5]MDY7394442.1 ABC transporter ATP-binding protein [Aureibaculum sp. 2210JD6-5]